MILRSARALAAWSLSTASSRDNRPPVLSTEYAVQSTCPPTPLFPSSSSSFTPHRPAPRPESADTRPAHDRTPPAPPRARSRESAATSIPSSGPPRPGTTAALRLLARIGAPSTSTKIGLVCAAGKTRIATQLDRSGVYSNSSSFTLPSASISFFSTAWPLTISSTGTCRVPFTRARSMCQYGCSSRSRAGDVARRRLLVQQARRLALDLQRLPALHGQHARPAAVARLADAQAIDLEIEQVREAVAAVAAAVAHAVDPVIEIERLVRPHLHVDRAQARRARRRCTENRSRR